jgi:hypothetical protein
MVEFDAAVTGISVTTVNVPPHTGTLAFPDTNPDGSVSVKPTPVKSIPPFGLVRVKVRFEGCWVTLLEVSTVPGSNAIAIAGGDALNAAVESNKPRTIILDGQPTIALRCITIYQAPRNENTQNDLTG